MIEADEAAPFIGVPETQLRRWAWLGTGPKNSGTRWKPKYLHEDLIEWRDAQHKHSGKRLAST